MESSLNNWLLQDSEWDEVSNDENGGVQDILHPMAVPSSVNPSVEHLDALAKAFDDVRMNNCHNDYLVFAIISILTLPCVFLNLQDDDNDDEYDNELTKVDPLNEVGYK